MTDIIARVADAADADGDGDTTELILDGNDFGDFYYLGFNNLFDNWYFSMLPPLGFVQISLLGQKVQSLEKVCDKAMKTST